MIAIRLALGGLVRGFNIYVLQLVMHTSFFVSGMYKYSDCQTSLFMSCLKRLKLLKFKSLQCISHGIIGIFACGFLFL